MDLSGLALSGLETCTESHPALRNATVAVWSAPEPCSRGSGAGDTEADMGGGGGTLPPPGEGYREGYRYRKWNSDEWNPTRRYLLRRSAD